MTAAPSSSDSIGQASEDDRLWFEAHPGRAHRVRPFVPGEGPEVQPQPGDQRLLVAVRQVQPGVRMRLAIYLPRLPADTEAVAASVFRRATREASR